MSLEIKIKLEDFPMLKNFKKKELDKIVFKMLKSGYQIHFPENEKLVEKIEYNGLLEKIDTIKGDINNSEISSKITLLESSLNKLIGISSNSTRKGNFGENILEELFNTRYGDITFERKSGTAHSGDAWLHLPDDKVIMLESKNYTSIVNKDEVIKLQNDMITHHIKWAIMVSFNSMIQGMKELDFITFTHNNETYSIIMISNLSTDIHKLDLGLQIIRKLISNLDPIGVFPWLAKDINHSLHELNQIVQKNYFLRDSYYAMEKDIQKTLSNYHVTLRDYQYDIEDKIEEIINKIQSTMKESIEIIPNNNKLIEKYKGKKILPLLTRLVDIISGKKWFIQNQESKELIIKNKDYDIGSIKIANKKITINILSNDLTFTLCIGKDKENKQNLEIINSL